MITALIGFVLGVLVRPLWNLGRWWWYYRQQSVVPMDADRISRIANGKL